VDEEVSALAALVAAALVAGLPAKKVPHFVKRVDVGGYKLAIECHGTGSPTVVLDSGFSTPRSAWYWVVPRLQRTTRVCSYDRAGLGESQSRPSTITPSTSVIMGELHTLLQRAGLQPPYVLGGWSIGGFDVRYYQQLYPADVAGLVLVDGTIPSFLLASDDPLDSGVEAMYTHDAADRLLDPPRLGSLPVVDLTHGRPLGDAVQEAAWVQGQRQVTSSTSSSLLVQARAAGHAIAEERPALVAYALELVVKSARRSSPLPACAHTLVAKYRGICLAPR
jgi:pimeloyl-ACP methyl ester carboxylesterase